MLFMALTMLNSGLMQITLTHAGKRNYIFNPKDDTQESAISPEEAIKFP